MSDIILGILESLAMLAILLLIYLALAWPIACWLYRDKD